jgi:hypothetical protein
MEPNLAGFQHSFCSSKPEKTLFSVDVHFPKMDVKPVHAGRQSGQRFILLNVSDRPIRTETSGSKSFHYNHLLSASPAEDHDICDIYIRMKADGTG